MTISCKFLDWAQLCEKVEIFKLDMSAVIKNDNFEKKSGIGPQLLEKCIFSRVGRFKSG